MIQGASHYLALAAMADSMAAHFERRAVNERRWATVNRKRAMEAGR
jgi:hypothetical protein